MSRSPRRRPFGLAVPAAVVLLPALALAGDPPVFPVTEIQITSSPDFIELGDLDGDGDADLLVVGTAEQFDFVENLGDGSFAAPVALPGSIGLARPRLIDLDDDGDLDLLLSLNSPGLNLVETRLNDGAGNFSASLFQFTAPGLKDVALGDLDHDGDLDLVAACADSDRMSVLLGSGFGTFAPRTDYGIGDSPRAICLGDFDEDGNLDAAVANLASDAVSLLFGDGLGGFVDAGLVSVGAGLAASPFEVVAGDFDDDGHCDLAVGHLSNNELTMLWGTGTGAFEPFVDVVLQGESDNLVVADMNEDGIDDLVAEVTGTWSVSVLLGGSRSFELGRAYTVGNGTVDVAVADVDADGELDVAVAGGSFFLAASVTLLRGDGRGQLGPNLRGTDGCSDIAAGDLDEDGILDAVITNELPVGENLVLRRGVEAGVFGPIVQMATDLAATAVEIADLDADGHLDLVLGHALSNNALQLHFGNGDLSFEPVVKLPVGGAVQAVQLGDLDADGDVDICAVAETNDTLVVALNDGSGGFPVVDLYTTADRPGSLALGDVSGDGILDAVVAAFNADVLHVYVGDGAGGFPSVFTWASADEPQGIGLGDLDEDGLLDVVTSSEAFAGGAYVHFGAGGGGLDPPVVIPTPHSSSLGVVVDDFDGDGHLDLALGDGSSQLPQNNLGVVTLHPGHGDGTFGAPSTTFTPTLGRFLVGLDVNGDGATDLGVPSYNDGVGLLINQRGPWRELGFPLDGSLGQPRQAGQGPLVAGQPYGFVLRDARVLADVFHVLGVGTIFAPFKGGTFVPAPTLINGPFMTDASGDLAFSATWPSGLEGLPLAFQFWWADPAGPVGFAASNAVLGTAP